jgi:hypothetical protein
MHVSCHQKHSIWEIRDERIPAGLSIRTVAVGRNTSLTSFAGTADSVYRDRSTAGGAT